MPSIFFVRGISHNVASLARRILRSDPAGLVTLLAGYQLIDGYLSRNDAWVLLDVAGCILFVDGLVHRAGHARSILPRVWASAI
jgi:hypothetical protein